MKVNELRIGNCIYEVGFSTQDGYPKGYKELGIIKNGKDIEFSAFKEHIPLTEEWLLKFGFEKKKDNYNRYYFSIDGMDIKIDGDEFATEVGECLYKTIKYVHQLQNLYFALNDEELTIM